MKKRIKENWKRSVEHAKPAFFSYLLVLAIYLILKFLVQEDKEILRAARIDEAALYLLAIASIVYLPDLIKFFKILFEKEDNELN